MSSGTATDGSSTTTGETASETNETVDPSTTTGDDTTTGNSSTGEPASSTGESSTGEPASTSDGTATSGEPSTSGDSSTGDSSTGQDASSSGGEPAQECPYGELMAPDIVMTSTLGQDSEFLSSCGGNGAPDVSYTLTAPVDGMYVIDTFGSDIDTILAVFDGVCGGDELACNNNDPDNSPQSRVSVPLTAGQTVTVVADGFALQGGDVQINVAVFEGTCPNGDLGNTVPQTYSGSTAAADNTLFGTCGGGQAADEAFTFTAPQAGIYTIDTENSNFDTVLYVRDGCDGAELACNDNAVGQTSRVNVTLQQDQEIVIVVDGAGLDEGDFDINIDLDACPDFDLGNTVPQTVMGSTAGEVNSSSGTCVGSSAPDVAYTFTAPFDGAFVFDTAGSDFDTGIYAFEGATCDGVQLACNDDAIGLQSEIQLDLVAGQIVTIVVDGFSTNSGNYTLNVSEYDSCGDGIVNGADACDGYALDQARCEDLGFAGGSLDCNGDCTFDTSECSNDVVAVCSTPNAPVDSNLPPATDTIVITDMGTIVDVDVFVYATHSWTADLDIQLLADDLGLSNDLSLDHCGSSDDVWAFFNDEGTGPVGDDCDTPFAIEGNLIPDTPLSIYDGNEAAGSWTLSITDDEAGIAGTFHEWCLYLTLQ